MLDSKGTIWQGNKKAEIVYKIFRIYLHFFDKCILGSTVIFLIDHFSTHGLESI